MDLADIVGTSLATALEDESPGQVYLASPDVRTISTHDAVRELQRRLRSNDLLPDTNITGTWDAKTQKALLDYQIRFVPEGSGTGTPSIDLMEALGLNNPNAFHWSRTLNQALRGNYMEPTVATASTGGFKMPWLFIGIAGLFLYFTLKAGKKPQGTEEYG